MTKEQRALVEKRIDELHEKYGEEFGPDVVVKDAERKHSPLHNCFEWDNSKAGHMYRLWQARTLIRSIQVKVVTETVEVRIPKYVRNPDADEHVQGYVRTADLMTDTERSVRALRYELERLDACIKRVQHIAAGLGFQAEADALAESAARLGDRVEAYG